MNVPKPGAIWTTACSTFTCASPSRPETIKAEEIPQDIEEKISEARRLNAIVRSEMGRTPLDKWKIMHLREKEKKLEEDVSDWLFSRVLEVIEETHRPSGGALIDRNRRF